MSDPAETTRLLAIIDTLEELLRVQERVVAEESARRRRLEEQRAELSRHAGMAQVATSVLHNVGNVLNSANVSASLAAERLGRMRIEGVRRAAQLLAEGQAPDPAKVFAYLEQLADLLAADRESVADELRLLLLRIEHIKNIVAMQQSFARPVAIVEPLSLADVARDAIAMLSSALAGIELSTALGEVPTIAADRHRVIEILVNLLSNAKDAVAGRTGTARIRVTVTPGDAGVACTVADNGVGIAPEHLSRIFEGGFTTKTGGHGFGLHASALAAQGLGGRLTAESAGPGQGACFRLWLPLGPPATP